jgi:DNA invertase Pin-like site-specific DNA recombinase
LADRGWVQLKLAAMISPAIKEARDTPIKVHTYLRFLKKSDIRTSTGDFKKRHQVGIEVDCPTAPVEASGFPILFHPFFR